MPTKFTPVTTQQLAPVQKNAELDGMIEIVQGLIQQRQSSQDRQFTLGQRDRLISGQGKEDEASAAKTESLTLFNKYMTEGGHSLSDVQNLAVTGNLDKNQISAIETSATDYQSPGQRLDTFGKILPYIADASELGQVIAKTGVDSSTGFRLWSEQEKERKAAAGSGTGDDTGGEDGGKPATLIQRTNAEKDLDTAKRELKQFSGGGKVYNTAKGAEKKDKEHYVRGAVIGKEGKRRGAVKVLNKKKTYLFDGTNFYLSKDGNLSITTIKDKTLRESLRRGYADYTAAAQKVLDLDKTLSNLKSAGYEREDGKGDRRNDDLFRGIDG